jgi:hypothetical protein
MKPLHATDARLAAARALGVGCFQTRTKKKPPSGRLV